MDEWVFPFCGSVLCDDGKMRPMRARFLAPPRKRALRNTLPEARTQGLPRWVGPMKSKLSTGLYARGANRP